MDTELLALSSCVQRRVTFSETDAVGYVHHSNAIIWFETAREAYFGQFGVPFAEYARKGLYLAVREVRVHYDSFVAYDDLLEIRCALIRLGRVALDLAFRVDNLTTGKLCVRGFSNMVAVEAREPGQPPALGRIRFDRAPFEKRVVSEQAFFA